MITVTANAFHEKLNIQEDEIILNGPPSGLTGRINIRNDEAETLFIRDLPMSPSQGGNNLPVTSPAFRFTTSLKGGEEKNYNVSHRLPSATPPGTYESVIQVGGVEKKVKMIVQPDIQVEINPLSIHFSGVIPGESYYTSLSFTNTGNMPFKIPDVKHATTLDEDYLCKATALAMRGKGGEGFMAMMDDLTRNIQKDMADWVTVKLEESGQVLQPGESVLLHLTLTLPKNVDQEKDYFGNVRLWNKTLSYNIKSH